MGEDCRFSTQPSFRNERIGVKEIGRVSMNCPSWYIYGGVGRNVLISYEGAAFTCCARWPCVAEIELIVHKLLWIDVPAGAGGTILRASCTQASRYVSPVSEEGYISSTSSATASISARRRLKMVSSAATYRNRVVMACDVVSNELAISRDASAAASSSVNSDSWWFSFTCR